MPGGEPGPRADLIMETLRGRFWQIDPNGFILNDASRDYLRPPFDAAVRALVDATAAHIGADVHSIYVTGSIARGLAVEGESDADVFAVLVETADPELVRQDWIRGAEEAVIAAHMCVSDAHIELWPYGYVFGRPDRFAIGGFIVKTHSVCLWGSDLGNELPDYRLGPAIANEDIVHLRGDIAEAAAAIKGAETPEMARWWCKNIMKSIVRAGFGLVMMEERAFTRDLDLCCEVFGRHYPGHAASMRQALDYARRPAQAGETLPFLEAWGEWMVRHADQWLDRYNPGRDVALAVDDLAEAEDD